MTKTLIIMTSILIFAGLLVGAIWYVQTMTPDTVYSRQKAAEVKAETALAQAKAEAEVKKLEALARVEELKNQRQSQAIEYKKQMAIINTPWIVTVRQVKTAWIEALPVIIPACVLIFGTVVFYGLTRWRPVEYRTGETATTIPMHKACQFVAAGLDIERLRATEGRAVYEAIEQGTNRRLSDNLRAMKLFKGLVPKESAPVQALPEQQEPAAIPAFTGSVHFSQVAVDGDYVSHDVCMGRNIESGFLVQLPLEDLQTLCVNGLQKTGKSVLLQSVAYNALYRKHVDGENVRVSVVDLHAGGKDSLLTRFETAVHGAKSLFDRTFEGEEEISEKLPEFLDHIVSDVKVAKAERKQPAPHVLIFDEYTETVSALENGKEIEGKVKRLFNYRKFGVYVYLAMFEGGKNANSAKGLNVSKMAVSKALFATNKDEGQRFMNGGGVAPGLEKGEYLLLLPGMQEPEPVKAPLFAPQDFAIFQKYAKALPVVPGEAEPEKVEKPTEMTEETTEETLRAQDVTKYLASSGLSQRKFAKLVSVSQSKISDFVHENDRLTPDEKAMIQAVIFETDERRSARVVSLNHWREKAENA